MSDRVLRAYYDLAVSPPSFDICVFLYLAEMERLHRGLDAFDLIVVANRDTGFRYDLIYKPMNEIIWRLNHVVLPAHKLVPACRRAVYYPDWEEALREFDPSKPIFPAGYTIGLPINKFLDSDVLTGLYAGKPSASLRASGGAVEKVKEWLDHHVGDRKPITITLRGEGFQPGRNSNLGEWIRFARALDPTVYCPVFVRDTADVFKPPNIALQDFLAFDPAALDIELRLALCELAHINLFVDSGPAVLCMLDDRTRSIRFKLFLENNPHAGAISFYRRGYSVGMQWVGTNTHQISVWEDDTAECIMREFTNLERQLQAGTPAENRPLPPVTQVASNMIAGQNYHDAITVTSLAVARNPDDLEARYLLATAFMRAREHLAALKEFEQLSNLSQTQDIVLIPFATCLWMTGRVKEAAKLLAEATRRRVNDAAFLKTIAQTLLEIGEEPAGLEALARLVQDRPGDSEVLIEYAKYFENDILTLPDAIATLHKALEWKPDNSRTYAMLADCHAQIGEYKEAIFRMEQSITLKGETTLKDWVRMAQWCQHIGDTTKAQAHLSRASKAVDARLDDNLSPLNVSIEWLASKAHIDLLCGSGSDANASYTEILRRYGPDPFQYYDEHYLLNTQARLERLNALIDHRDAFIFCNGPSIKALDHYWANFVGADACLMAANEFHFFEARFLAQTQSKVDIAIAVDNGAFRNAITEFVTFLSRDSENLLITLRHVLERLGSQCPSRQQLEARFDKKLLYFGGMSHITPATPYNPTRCIYGNPLSNMIFIAAIGGARRIFIFGADGAAQTDLSQGGYFGLDQGGFRLDVTEQHLPILRKAVEAQARNLGHVTAMNLIAARHLFEREPPPIYNVSSDSTIDAFPRISYDEALEMLENDTAINAAVASSR